MRIDISPEVSNTNAPKWFTQAVDKNGVTLVSQLPADWAHIFFKTRDQLHTFCVNWDLSQINKALWVSWPKKTSGIKTKSAATKYLLARFFFKLKP